MHAWQIILAFGLLLGAGGGGALGYVVGFLHAAKKASPGLPPWENDK